MKLRAFFPGLFVKNEKEHLCKGSLFESFAAETAVHVDAKNTNQMP